MTKVTIDLNGYKDRIGGRAEPGVYNVVVEDIEMDQTSKPDPKTGKPSPMINVWLRVQGGDYDGTTVIDRLVQRDTTLFRTVNFLQALGIPTPRKRFNLELEKLVGKKLSVELADGQPYQGRPPKSEVRGYMRAKLADAHGRTTGPSGEAERPGQVDAGDLPADDLDDVSPDQPALDNAEEFAAETTQNPSPQAQERRQRPVAVVDDEPADNDTPRQQAAAQAPVDGPEEIDIDDLDLDDEDLG